MKTINTHGRKDQILINVKYDDFAARFFEIISKRLYKSYILKSEIDGNKLKFKGSIFRFVWNGWDLFNAITQGQIEFTQIDDKSFIEHKINFNEALVIALLYTIIPLFTLKYEPLLSLIVFLLIWILYAVNYFVAVFRFNSYISETLIETNETVGYELQVEQEPFN